ncbi:IMP dehydrogenase, partial [Natronobacterium gregoryi]
MANDVPEHEPYSSKLQVPEALTFDDVLLRPKESRVEPDDADLTSQVSTNVAVSVPILSAAMDTVTESEMAIAMARHGGLGVLHRNMNVDEMVEEIERVKSADELVIPAENVVTADPEMTVREVDNLMAHEGVGGAPVVNTRGEVLGIISSTDIRPHLEVNEDDPVTEAMTDEVITVDEGVDPRDAFDLMYEHKIERVPVVDDENLLVGLVTMQGILQRREYKEAVRDEEGRLRLGVAVSPFEDDRAEAADEAGADILFIDTAHAHNRNVIEGAREIKETVEADVVVGNVGTREAAQELVDFADGIKVG